jgi:putative transposase
MREEEKEQKALSIQEFRYGVITDLTNPYLKKGEIKRLIRDKARRQYDIPYSKRKTITASCIRKWLTLFQNRGKDGLMPQPRKDSGMCRCLTRAEVDAFSSYLEKHPYMSAKAVLLKLKKEGNITSSISSSSLSRLVIAHGLTRNERLAEESKERHLKFNFFYPLECVQADCMYGPPVSDSKGKMRKAILMAFLDDATRRIVFSEFSFKENHLLFEDGIKHILSCHGKIIRLYTDNGPAFTSSQTKRICDSLGIILTHSRPYKPKGRGKIERFFRTVRDQFLRPHETHAYKSLDELDFDFRMWLETEYHRTPHRGLNGNTPLDAWLSNTRYITHIDVNIDLDWLFLHSSERKIYHDNTFSLNGVLYETTAMLMGKKVKILYDPRYPHRNVYLYYQGKSYGCGYIVDTYANTKVRRNTYNPHIDEDNEPDGNPSPASGPEKVPPSLSPSFIDLTKNEKEVGK